MSVQRIELTDSISLSRISRKRAVGDYGPVMLQRDRFLPPASFLRSLVGAESVAELRAMHDEINRELDPTFRMAVGIGRTNVPTAEVGSQFRPTHFVSAVSFEMKDSQINGEVDNKRTRMANIYGPVFIHDLHNIVTSPYIAETSATDNIDCHASEKIQIGVRMLRDHISEMPRDYALTVIAMPVRRMSNDVYDITDWDASITHQMLLGVAFDSDNVWYRSLNVGQVEYGLYYYRNKFWPGDLAREVGSAIYNYEPHLDYFRRILSTWSTVNFPREIALVSSEQVALKEVQIAQMVQETVDGYRRVFREEDGRPFKLNGRLLNPTC